MVLAKNIALLSIQLLKVLFPLKISRASRGLAHLLIWGASRQGTQQLWSGFLIRQVCRPVRIALIDIDANMRRVNVHDLLGDLSTDLIAQGASRCLHLISHGRRTPFTACIRAGRHGLPRDSRPFQQFSASGSLSGQWQRMHHVQLGAQAAGQPAYGAGPLEMVPEPPAKRCLGMALVKFAPRYFGK